MVKTLVRDASELSDLLERIYGERIEINPLEEYIGNIDATLDTIKFKITFRTDHYLIISTKKSSKEIIDKLFSLLTKVMGGENPICRYDLPQLESDIIEDEEVLEWDIATPEERLKEIVNGIAFPGCEKIYNLKLYNGREISYYLETEEEKKERIENTKIYGIYPKVLKLKMDFLETEKKAVRENECIVKLQNKKLLGLWRKDFIELSQEVLKKKKVKSAKKEASDNFGNVIYQQEQSAIISGEHLKIQNLFALLKKFKERKFLIFCVYRDKVANKLFELIESKYGSGSVDYLNKGDRKKILDAFNDPQSDLRYLIATDKDSQGIDLQQSEAWIIHYELPWNPIRVIQRFGRVWRLNKPNAENADDELTRPVAFYIPSTYSAEEEKINRLQRRWKTLEKVLPKLSSKCLPPIRFDLALGIRVTPSPYKECTCCGKDGKRKMLYSTESEALIAAKRRSKKKIPLRVYQCPDECGYHLTSNQE